MYVLCSVVAKITKATVVLQLIFLFNKGGAQVTGFITVMLYPSQVVSYIYKWTPGAYIGLCPHKTHWCPSKNNVES